MVERCPSSTRMQCIIIACLVVNEEDNTSSPPLPAIAAPDDVLYFPLSELFLYFTTTNTNISHLRRSNWIFIPVFPSFYTLISKAVRK